MKNRPLSGLYINEKELKLELTYQDETTNRGRYITIISILLFNAGLCCIPNSQITSIIVALVGSLTSPLVIFVLPGYLFYKHAKDNNTNIKYHRSLSLLLLMIGLFLLASMTTISVYLIRHDMCQRKEDNYEQVAPILLARNTTLEL